MGTLAYRLWVYVRHSKGLLGRTHVGQTLTVAAPDIIVVIELDDAETPGGAPHRQQASP
jgi:hypothetical protein